MISGKRSTYRHVSFIANILNVLRPHWVKLLKEGQLAYHQIGRHRRVLLADLMQFNAILDMSFSASILLSRFLLQML
jgi:excisionase family DNA binding protein